MLFLLLLLLIIYNYYYFIIIIIYYLLLFIIINILGDYIRITEINANMLLNACKNIGLAENIEKTMYMEVGHYRGMRANEHITIGNHLYEKVKTLRYLGY